MHRVRRTRYLFFRVLDDGTSVALSVLCGVEVPLDEVRLDALRAIPSAQWQDVRLAGSADDLAMFADNGLIVTDSLKPSWAELRRRDEQLAAPAWNRYAALFHAFTRWSDVRAVVSGERPIPTTPDRWPPPTHFYSVSRDDQARVELPLTEPTRPLYDLLRARKSTRGFDADRAVSLDDLSTVLRFVWGCHGTLPVLDPLVILKKTSPSGGSQHPVEVYPLIQSVAGIDSGLYHYSTQHHALEPIELLAQDRVRELVREFSAGQEHFVGAHVVFLMTARYARNFWKYQAHAKAYRAVMLDAAHLSQTMFLVCTDLGLGAFVAGAINEQNVDRYLKLQPFTEGTVLMAGCGIPAPSDREPEFAPYRPGRQR